MLDWVVYKDGKQLEIVRAYTRKAAKHAAKKKHGDEVRISNFPASGLQRQAAFPMEARN
jgi:hypothetical protein